MKQPCSCVPVSLVGRNSSRHEGCRELGEHGVHIPECGGGSGQRVRTRPARGRERSLRAGPLALQEGPGWPGRVPGLRQPAPRAGGEEAHSRCRRRCDGESRTAEAAAHTREGGAGSRRSGEASGTFALRDGGGDRRSRGSQPGGFLRVEDFIRSHGVCMWKARERDACDGAYACRGQAR